MKTPPLGQHFLKNKKALTTMISALHLETDDVVIEIGPGKGALTIPLLQACKEKNCSLTVIEKDVRLLQELSPLLREHSASSLEGDVLNILPELLEKYKKGRIKLIGNIPYYLSGKLFRILGESPLKPVRTVLTIQKEVALRALSKPPRMNLLSATTRVWCAPELIQTLSAKDFDPPPRVSSATILLTPLPHIDMPFLLSSYFPFTRLMFAQPRKTILNNLSLSFPDISKQSLEETLRSLGLSPSLRPHDLSVESLTRLSTLSLK